MMVNRCFAEGSRRAAMALVLLAFAWLGLGLAWAQSSGGSTALPPLPAVQDEVVGYADAAQSPPTPVATPAMPIASASGSVAPTPAVGGRFASVSEARDSLREAFAARNYTVVLSLAAEARRQFPGENFMLYFETQARLQLQNGGGDSAKTPYQHLDSLSATPLSGQSERGAAVATPTPTSTPTAAPTAQATPAPTPRTTPAPAASRKMDWNQLLNSLDDLKLYLLGGAGLVAVGLVAVAVLIAVLARRGKRSGDESEATEAGRFGVAPAMPGPAASGDGGKLSTEREYPIESGLARPVFRSEVHAMAAARPLASVSDETPPEREDEPEARLEFNPDEILFHPVTEPASEPTPESGPEPGLLSELVPPGMEEAPGGPPDSPHLPAIGEAGEPFDFSKDYVPPRLEPELSLPDFQFEEYGVEASPAEAAKIKPCQVPLTPAAIGGYDPNAFAAGPPLGSPMGEETTGRQDAEPAEELEFHAFHPGETVRIRVNPQEDIEDEVDRTMASAMPAAGEDNKTMDKMDGTTDVFEREYQQGLKDMEARNWVGSIHHLSIAAALRPGASEVKDRLREARRMRARELEGRA